MGTVRSHTTLSPREAGPMSAHDDNRAAKATALVGAVTQQALSTAGRLAFAGVSTGLRVLGHANSVRNRIHRGSDTVLQIASMTPLGRLLPEPSFDDGAEIEGHRIAHPPAEPPAPRPARGATSRPRRRSPRPRLDATGRGPRGRETGRCPGCRHGRSGRRGRCGGRR